MTDARAITLRPEVMGAPAPDARALRLAVEVLMTHVLPVVPQTGHLRFTGYAAPDARARTLSAEVMSAGHPEARAITLAVEVMTPNIEIINTSFESGAGHVTLTGRAPSVQIAVVPPAPAPASPIRCARRFVIPAGRLYFAPAAGAAEWYLGETPGAELSVDIKTVEVYGADAKVSELIAEIPVGVARELAFQCVQPSDDTIGWFFGVNATPVTQTAGTVTDEALDAAAPDTWYQLGRTAGNPTGARLLSNVVVTDAATPTPTVFIQDRDYTVDLALGRLYVVPGGTIAAGTPLRVDYAMAAATRTRHAGTPLLTARLTGALRFIAHHTSGPNRDIYAPRVVLRADGAVTVKRAQQDGKVQALGFRCRFQRFGDQAAMYIDGRAVA